MVNFDDSKHDSARVQWQGVDVESAARPKPTLHRTNSQISINSIYSRRGSIDPSNALPIQYRTV